MYADISKQKRFFFRLAVNQHKYSPLPITRTFKVNCKRFELCSSYVSYRDCVRENKWPEIGERCSGSFFLPRSSHVWSSRALRARLPLPPLRTPARQAIVYAEHILIKFNYRIEKSSENKAIHLDPVQTPYFTWAESNANEGEQRIFLICIRFGACEVRRLNLA